MTWKRSCWKAKISSLKGVMRAGNFPFRILLQQQNKTGPEMVWTGQFFFFFFPQAISDHGMNFLDLLGLQNSVRTIWNCYRRLAWMVPIIKCIGCTFNLLFKTYPRIWCLRSTIYTLYSHCWRRFVLESDARSMRNLGWCLLHFSLK